MSEPFIAEIKVISFNFPPKGWAFCNGQLLPINQNQALFSILGTVYGGDGRTTFALPNFQGRLPLHQGNGFTLGERGGEAAHTLTIPELPTHLHPPNAQSTASSPGQSPAGAIWATAPNVAFAPAPNIQMNPAAVANAGGSQPHNNESPYLVLNFIIALVGIFPSQN
jgi:microcystin-dependent protein